MKTMTLCLLSGLFALGLAHPAQAQYTDYVDVWAKDLPRDTGWQPEEALFGKPMWKSPDIWNRRVQDGRRQNQRPVVNRLNYLYIRVRNRGNATATGTRVRVYVALSSSGLAWPRDWQPFPVVQGQPVQFVLPAIAPGGELVFNIPWSHNQAAHFCFLVRIDNDRDRIGTERSDVDYNARYNNNIVWRNFESIDFGDDPSGLSGGADAAGPEPVRLATAAASAGGSQEAPMVVRNVSEEPQLTALRFREDACDGPSLLERVRVLVRLDPKLAEIWWSGGAEGYGIKVHDKDLVEIEDLGKASLVFKLDKLEEYPVTLVFEDRGPTPILTMDEKGEPYQTFLDEGPGTFVLDVIQEEVEKELVVGGVSYEIRLP